jgi:hypothetical protein
MHKGLVALMGIALSTTAFPKAGPEWAQLNMSPQQKKWFNEQVKPGTKAPCCSAADGEEVQEDIREGVYWILSKTTRGEWLRVPPESVITEPNRWGQPLAWFRHESGKPFVYCFSPGALL